MRAAIKLFADNARTFAGVCNGRVQRRVREYARSRLFGTRISKADSIR
ncbi:hypothetical protein K788_0009104 [Paraburkholderia caribensis MBA4]|uniref:Uncharacterized protein n=1 Tax=Paraburkholderia caribensis MBA4 TaxID=1323664 RepID=A0A0P0RJ52_9BURK|nr:hypothetical protein K788_0009104 [Paraburkholderia caribensis MBA4]